MTRTAEAEGAQERSADQEGAAPEVRQSGLVVVASALALLLLYALVAGLGDVRAYSGSDAGGKAATASVMAERGTLEPDVGYWAEEVDPDGAHHPLVNTEPRGTQWVQGTSLPFSIASARLWDLGGASAALLLPAAGALLGALAARRLARGLGGGLAAGEAAFWLVGAAGPVGFYALELWEHAPATGLVVFAVASIVRPRNGWDAAAAGLAAGAAVVLRAESALVLGAVGVAVLATGPLRQAWMRRWRWAVAGAVGAAVPVVANALVERRYLGGDLRGDRASTLAAGAGSALGGRLQDAIVETATPFADSGPLGAATGLALAACALGLAFVALGRWKAPLPVVRVMGAVLAALYLARLLQGPGFLPGMLAVSPLAAAGIVAGLRGTDERPEIRAVALGSIGALPFIWLLQWQGNHSAQWGGRYLLPVGALLTVVGVVAVFRPAVPRLYRVAMIGLAVLVAVVGLAWHVQRTATVGEVFEELDALPDDTVVVATDPNLLREGGSWYRGGRWLTVTELDDLFQDGGLADELGIDRVAVALDVEDRAGAEVLASPPGFVVAEEAVLDKPGGHLRVVTLDRDG